MNRSEHHTKVLDEIHHIFEIKAHDYNNSFSIQFEKFGLVAPVVRMSDKMARLETLLKREALVKDESIRDTLLDLANYAILTVMELDNKEASHE